MCSEQYKLKAHERNIKIIMLKMLVQGKYELKQIFQLGDLKELFYFRQTDYKNSFENFFSKNADDKVVIKPEIQKELEGWLENHKQVEGKLEDVKSMFKSKFEVFLQYINEYGWDKNAEMKLEKFRKEVESEIEDLHWGILPIYDEDMMGEVVPETNLKKYYHDYYALEDLFKIINGKETPLSLKGDINLNQKLQFKVYSRRWGHYDNYIVTRLVNGWDVRHIAINGFAEKDGSGNLLGNLKHDSIQYPEDGVKYAFETLWNLADETEMTVEELQIKIQEIADWISEVEKVTGKFQPDWCNYY